MNELFEEVREKLDTLVEEANDLSTAIVGRGGSQETNLPGMLTEIEKFFTGGEGIVWTETNENHEPVSIEFRCDALASSNNWAPYPILCGKNSLRKIRFKPTPNALQYKMSIPSHFIEGCVNIDFDDINFYGIKLNGSIGNYAFANCTNLQSFDFTILDFMNNSYTHIYPYAFNNSGLENINISVPEYNGNRSSQLTLYNNAFSNCKHLETVTLTNIYTFSGGDETSGVFYNSKIGTLRISSTNGSGPNWNNYQFVNCEIKKVYLSEIGLGSNYIFMKSDIEELYISNVDVNETNARYQVFADCYKLTLVEINNIGVIGYKYFENCQLLETVTINGINNIGNNVFKNCPNLTTLEITMNDTENTTYIGTEIIYDCISLTSITINKPENTPLNINQYAFSHSALTDIYVSWAEGEVDNAPWGATNATIHYNSI